MTTYICALLLCLAVSTFANTDLDLACTDDPDICPAESECLYRYQGDTVCLDNGCFCNEGYIAVPNNDNGECLPKREIDESCTNIAQCLSTTIGSLCDGLAGNKKCVCDPVHGIVVEPIDGMKYCHTHKFGVDCENDGDLCLAVHFGNSVCDADDGCACAAGYKQSGQKCVRATHEEACGVDADNVECDADKNLECTQDDVCECEANYSWDGDHHYCIHEGATQVGNGADCDDGLNRYDNNGEYCPTSHECKTCPGEPNANTKCLIDADESGASAVTITSTLMVMIGSLYAILV